MSTKIDCEELTQQIESFMSHNGLTYDDSIYYLIDAIESASKLDSED